MVVSLSYDLSILPESRMTRGEVENLIQEILHPFLRCHVLTTYYLMKVNSEQQRRDMLNALQQLGENLDEQKTARFRFIMSPTSTHRYDYDGWLNKSDWECKDTLYN